MLTDSTIDKLIQPLINRQNQIEMAAIQKIAKRIGEVKTMLPSDVYKLERLLKNGSDVREINKEIARLTKLQEKDIKKIIKTVAKDAYADAKPYYDYRKKPFISFEENEELQKAIKATEQVTLQEFNNLSNATAFMMRDPARGNFLFPTSISKTYQNMVDTAIHSVVFNSESYNTVIPKTIKELIDSGLKTVEYNHESKKKRTVRLDAAVRRNILDGIRNINQTVQNITGEQFGANGVEIDVHSMSAPDHEPVQGHQFTKKEFFEGLQVGKSFIDVEGNYFAPIDRPIGLWNCTHNYMSIIVGVFKPVHTKEQLEQIKKNNANGYTYINKDGEKVTKSKYWCTQKMRDYELDIKKAKEGEAAAKLAKETDIEAQYHAEVIKKQNQYTQFCKDCGLKPRYENIRIYTADSQIKSIDKIAESGIIESRSEAMYRKSKQGKIEPMPKKQLHKIEKNFRAKGGVFQHDDSTDAYLRSKNAEAVTYNSKTILLRKNPGRASVFEELIHATQYRNGENDGSYVSRLKCEIEAQKKLLKYSKAYKLTEFEIIQTKKALNDYENELNAYIIKEGGD